jgi:LysM repeat protein
LLPPTQPGVGRDEGTFLITSADDGSRVAYFIAGNARHSIVAADMQLELGRNPLWPVRSVSRDEVLAYVEGAPIGTARSGLLQPPPSVEPVAAEPVVEEAPTAEREEPSAAPTLHVVRPGENLTRLSAQYGTTIQAILAANGLADANRVYAGKALVIPGAAALPEASANTTAVDETAPVAEASESPEEADAPAGLLAAAEPPDGATTYTVQRGDSAVRIARRFGVDVDVLLAANGVQDRNRIYAGQVLTIPGGSS